MALIKVEPFQIDTVANFVFGNTTITSNLTTGNANLGNLVTANYFSGSGNNLSNIQVANVTGLGNIATINKDGNASNILYGNGTFASAPVTYGNSNVATFLASFGSNTITTTGDISVGNITANNLGNISSINTDGNASNILYGNGVFAAAPEGGGGGGGSANSPYVTRTYTGNGSTVGFTVSSGATTNSVIVTLSGVVQTPTTDYSISSTTLTFTSAPANGVVIQIREIGIPMASGSNSQILFNDAGSIGGTANLTFNKTTGMLTAAKLTATSANLGPVANLRISGGNVGDILASLGNGQMAWANIAANGNVIVNGSVGGGSGGASVTVDSTAPSSPTEGDLWLDSESGELNVYFGGAWASVTESAGQLDIQVDNFTGDGINSSFTLSRTPIGISYTIVTIGGIVQPRTFYSLTGATLEFGSAPPSNTPIEITMFGGTASPIGLASAVTNSSQPNITSVGTLTTLVVSGNATTGNISSGNVTVTSNVSAGNATITSNVSAGNLTVTANATVGNLKTDHLLYANGSAYVFTTNAAGSDTQIQFNNSNSFAGSANLTFNNTTNTLSVTNIVTTSANLGAIANVKITGGTSGQALVTDGTGNLSFGSAGMSAAKVVGYNLVFGG